MTVPCCVHVLLCWGTALADPDLPLQSHLCSWAMETASCTAL